MATVDDALRTLLKLYNAAPPLAAARIADVMNVVQTLRAENARLIAQLDSARRGDTMTAEAFVPPDSPASLLDFIDEPEADSETFGGFADLDLPKKQTGSLDEPVFDPSVLGNNLILDTGTLTSGRDLFDEQQQGAAEEELIDQLATVLLKLADALKPRLEVVQTQANALLTSVTGALNNDQRMSIEAIQTEANATLSMLSVYDTIRQLSQGTYELGRFEFPPYQLIQMVADDYATAAEARDHQLIVEADAGLPRVVGDYVTAQMILGDLVDNALRYSPVNSTTRITAETLGTHVLFTVADAGVGLNEKDLAHIGEPFWRGTHQPLVRQHEGTGLRLFLARTLLSRMNGELFFSGEPGLGSSFSFTLPVSGS
ncbi:sensor histidine kinase [Anaerolineae bacterium CFX9]|jgi:signal transduction histidine kinase|nr:sensor histidine kinase [Anaerolineae bacterium CFX9]